MTEHVADRYDAVLFDLDGTLYYGPHAVRGAAASVDRLRTTGAAVRFVTNNASKTPNDVAAQLIRLGIPADADAVGTSAQAAAALLAEHVPADAEVLIVGTDALAAEVTARGLRSVRDTDTASAVVQGHSPETGWPDLAHACLCIGGGAVWVACNLDVTLPTERGQLPGNGAMVGALRMATGAQPLVAGKPEPTLFRHAAATARRPLVVGDRLDTDIAGAVAAEMAGLLVLSGTSQPADLLVAPVNERPTYVATDVTELNQPLDELAIGPRPGWRLAAGDDEVIVAGAGGTDPLDLLRALCAFAWQHGHTRVRAANDSARAALDGLGIGA